MLGNIYDAMADMNSGIYDFTVDGQCSSCGSCCSNFLPMSDMEISRIKRYIAYREIKEQKHFVPASCAYVDMTCPFRDNASHKCVIYEARPAICRDFRCDKAAKGIQVDTAMYHGKYGVVNVRRTFFLQKEGGSDW